VALALDNGIDWVLWDLAALHAGLVCVPLPSFFSAEQQRHVLDSAGIDCLIGAAAPGFACVENDIYRRTVVQPAELHPGTCKITFTSGTTGQPKGVCLDLDTQLAVARSLVAASASRNVERHLCILPLATLLENIAGIYAPLLAGARVELMPMAQVGLSGASGFDLMRFLQALQAAQPHSLILLPQLLLALVSAAERKLPVPDSLRFVAVGGGRVSPQLLERADALELPIFEGYGLSECASVVCLNTPERHRIGSTGQPLGHLQVTLAADGEVLVKGARMLGYLGEPAPQGEWLGTGDLGHFEQGFLVLHGRKKHQFITAYGRNVNPEWVESELVQQLPVAQAWLHGEALPANVAVLVARFPNTSDAQLQEAVDTVNSGLPDYARVHHWLRADAPFTTNNDLATANGRLRRVALLDHYQRAIDELMAEGVSA
jgi:long-subunit acyl-CoA synthetase (AMP-forming)